MGHSLESHAKGQEVNDVTTGGERVVTKHKSGGLTACGTDEGGLSKKCKRQEFEIVYRDSFL